MKQITTFITIVFLIFAISCSAEKDDISSSKNWRAKKGWKSEVISVVLFVNSSAELGSFSVSIRFEPAKLEFLEVRNEEIKPFAIKHHFDEEKHIVKFIAYNSGETGFVGNSRLAVLYFRNRENLPLQKLKPYLKVCKEQSYSPMPNMNPVSADFKIEVYPGLKTR